MNQETYDYVLEILSREPSFSEGIRQLKSRWPTVFESVSEKTLKSIQAQYYVRRMRRNHYHHYSRDTREKYYKLYKAAKSRSEKNVIMRLASKNDISPCLLARIILEEYYWNDVDHGRVRERADSRGSLPPGFMTDCIRDIAKLPNPELASEIYETIVLDNFYGPAVDSIKKCCGAEYEIILKARCREAGFSVIDESQMRDEGYDKTPDIKLKVPVMINSRVVNWIESKASFGDPINHQQYMIDQYLPYKNRFGPGAVIYWFGFVKELAETGERGILLLSNFPEAQHITHLRDVHKQEMESIGIHFKLDATAEADDLCDLGSDKRDRFYNYVDPMFDSDEDSGLTDGSFANAQRNCGYSNVSSDSDLELKRCDSNGAGIGCVRSLQSDLAGCSLDSVGEKVNSRKCDTSYVCEIIKHACGNRVHSESKQTGGDSLPDICSADNTCQTTSDIVMDISERPPQKEYSGDCAISSNFCDSVNTSGTSLVQKEMTDALDPGHPELQAGYNGNNSDVCRPKPCYSNWKTLCKDQVEESTAVHPDKRGVIKSSSAEPRKKSKKNKTRNR